MIPAEAVEAVARLLAEASPEDWSGDQWSNEKIHDAFRKPWREQAKALLEAAAPHMLEAAYTDGYCDGMSGDQHNVDKYRPTP